MVVYMNTKQSLGTRLITILISLAILLGILAISQCSKKKEEVAFSPDLEFSSPAYIDLITIEPVYSVSEKMFSSYNAIVCKCTTTSRDTVWLYITISDYKKHFDPDAKFDYILGSSFETVSKRTRIHGKTINPDTINPDLSQKTSNMILEFKSISNID